MLNFSFKTLGVMLTMAALTTNGAIHAHHHSHGSHHSHRSHHSHHHSHCPEIPSTEFILAAELAEGALHRILNDLNVIFLALSVPPPTAPGSTLSDAIDAYNLDITSAALIFQNALESLGMTSSPSIADAFNNYAIAAEEVASGTGSIADLFTQGLILAQALASLSPSIDETVVINFIQQLITAQTQIISQDQALNFSAAILFNNQAHLIANELLDYILINLTPR